MKTLFPILLLVLASCGDECYTCLKYEEVTTVYFDGGSVTSPCLNDYEQSEWIIERAYEYALYNPYAEVTDICIIDEVVTCDPDEYIYLGYDCGK